MAEIKIKADSSGGTVSLKGPATTTGNAAVQLTLPQNDGDAGQYLKTDGSGNLSWATVTSNDNTPAFSAYLNADQTGVAHDTETKVVFNAEIFDTDNAYNTSDGLFTVPSGKGGKYQVNAQVAFDDIDTGGERCEFYLYVDGSKLSDYRQSAGVWGVQTGQLAAASYSHVIQLNAGQTLGIYAYHTDGSDIHLQHEWTFFSAFRLAGV